MNPLQILSGCQTIVVIDWPSRDVPESLVRAGFEVVVRGGPGPQDYSAYELRGDEIVPRPMGHAPEHADLVYTYRPPSEWPEIVAFANKLGAKTLWTQSGLAADGLRDRRGCWLRDEERESAQAIMEAAGLTWISAPYIGEAAARSGRTLRS